MAVFFFLMLRCSTDINIGSYLWYQRPWGLVFGDGKRENSGSYHLERKVGWTLTRLNHPKNLSDIPVSVCWLVQSLPFGKNCISFLLMQYQITMNLLA